MKLATQLAPFAKIRAIIVKYVKAQLSDYHQMPVLLHAQENIILIMMIELVSYAMVIATHVMVAQVQIVSNVMMQANLLKILYKGDNANHAIVNVRAALELLIRNVVHVIEEVSLMVQLVWL